MILRLRHQLRGGHVHCRLFTARQGDRDPAAGPTFAKAGDLVFAVGEWPEVSAALGLVFELLPEEGALVVGDVVRVGRPCMGNEAGAAAVVVEVYELERRPGWALLFANGNYDGFSPADLALFEVAHIGRADGLADYHFKNASALHADWRAGRFAAVWRHKQAAQGDSQYAGNASKSVESAGVAVVPPVERPDPPDGENA